MQLVLQEFRDEHVTKKLKMPQYRPMTSDCEKDMCTRMIYHVVFLRLVVPARAKNTRLKTFAWNLPSFPVPLAWWRACWASGSTMLRFWTQRQTLLFSTRYDLFRRGRWAKKTFDTPEHGSISGKATTAVNAVKPEHRRRNSMQVVNTVVWVRATSPSPIRARVAVCGNISEKVRSLSIFSFKPTCLLMQNASFHVFVTTQLIYLSQ